MSTSTSTSSPSTSNMAIIVSVLDTANAGGISLKVTVATWYLSESNAEAYGARDKE